MPGLYRRKDPKTGEFRPIWWGWAFVGGRKERRSLRTGNRAEAQKRLDAWAAELRDKAFWNTPDRVSYLDAVIAFFQEATHLKPGTIKRYRVSAKQVDRTFREMWLDEIDRRAVAGYVAARKLEAVTNRTIKRDLTFLSQVLTFACAADDRLSNPVLEFLSVAGKTVKEKKVPRPDPSDDLVGKLVATAPAHMARLILFLRHTGLREDEAVTLTHDQVRLKDREIILTDTKTTTPRTVPLNAEAVGTLKGTPIFLGCPFVFWHPTKTDGKDGADRYRNFASNFSRVAERAEYPYDCHSLRHKFARDFLRQGGDIYALKNILGHASVKTTEVYLDSATGDLHAEVRRVDRTRNRAHEKRFRAARRAGSAKSKT